MVEDVVPSVASPLPTQDWVTPGARILGMRLDALGMEDILDRVVDWALRRESRYICQCTVHGVMEGYDSPAFQRAVNGADIVASDGMPIVWGLRWLGLRLASRVRGPDITRLVCERATERGLSVGFYGGTPEVLAGLTESVRARFPGLRVGYAFSPPFRQLSMREDWTIVQAIRRSEVRILFVGLGCPKQERWMAAHRGAVPAVMMGVGAAFDLLAGARREPPDWMKSSGLEWLFRLTQEPRRLWWRYLYHNPRFVALFARQLLTERLARSPRASSRGARSDTSPPARAVRS